MRETQLPALDTHTLIGEFRTVLQHPELRAPTNTQAVVILSAPFVRMPDGNLQENSPENEARIKFGIELLRQIAADRTHKPDEESDFKDAPPLVLNGETDQLPIMERIALQAGIPREMIELVDNIQDGVGNTKTQFTAMEQDPRFAHLQHAVFVTSLYHVPRVERTAEENLPGNTDYEVIPVPIDKYPFNIFMIRGEIRRIWRYAASGDIAQVPHHLRTDFQE